MDDDDDDNDMQEETTREFSVKVINLTNNQPFSPITGLLHGSSYQPYSLGTSASSALETLAESGDNSAFLSNANVDNSAAGSGILAPGANETIMLESDDDKIRLSLLTMLVNTNDGFAAIEGVDISGLEKNESLMLHAKVYDAGTEANSEAAADVPGQMGEGFNMTRDDRDFVSVHSGIVSMEDGLTTSALDSSHRFDNPGAKVIITRIN